MKKSKTNGLTMYEACLLHARADRVLRSRVSDYLENFDITRLEWLLLATIEAAEKSGIIMGAAAKTLDVTMPQITALSNVLIARALIKQQVVSPDRRSRSLHITERGQKLISKIEYTMRDSLREWLADIPRHQLETYINTVTKLGNR